MKRVVLLALVTVVAATGAAGGASSRTLRGNGVTLSLPRGWHGLVGSAGVQAADFPLPLRARSSASLVHVRHGHVHLIVLNYGPWVPYLRLYRPARPPLALRKRDVLRRGLEGFGSDDTFALRNARVGGEMIELVADLGPKPFAPSALRRVNSVLTTLRAPPPLVLRPRHRRLIADGVSAHLLAGWTGRIEIPADRYGARIVLRAGNGRVRVELVELTAPPAGGHLDLPVALRSRDILHRYSPPLARRVFSTGGRSFDLTATAPAAGDLREVNRFLTTLAVVPRPWTFRSCDLTLRLPGTWRAGVRPRARCYPVLTLHGPHVLVVLTELRPGGHTSGRILRRADRRFRVEVSPASARARANAVLSTLRSKPRSCVIHSCDPQA